MTMASRARCSLAVLLAFLLRTSCDGHTLLRKGRSDVSSITLSMPGARPSGADDYLCHAFDQAEVAGTSDSLFVTRFTPVHAEAERAHHMILYACNHPGDTGIFDCRHHMVCGDQPAILYAWAKNAEATELPNGVSFELNPGEHKYLVLQVHYMQQLGGEDNTGLKLDYQLESTRYSASIYLLLRGYLPIPPNTPVVHGDVNCQAASKMHPFAFRTHAHSLGVVITGYKYSPETQEFMEIARGNPQWPQAFYPITTNVTVQPGDFMVARCTYNSTGRQRLTSIGPTGEDEMCNLYLMYYTDSGHAKYELCMGEHRPEITKQLPSDSDQPLPRNPLLEEMAMHKKTPQRPEQSGGRRKGDLDSPKAPDVLSFSSSSGRRKGDLDNPDDDYGSKEKALEIQMPGAEPKRADEYFCTAFDLGKLTGGRRVYATAFDARATADRAHHLIVEKCQLPFKEEGQIWNCLHHATCQGESKILFAWAKDAPPTSLPPDVGFELDPEVDGYLVLQVHYAQGLQDKDYTGLGIVYTEEKPLHTAGVLLLFRSYLSIPPHRPKVHGDINCKLHKPATLFAFRTHAHKLGAVITGYSIKGDQVKEIARGDPQKPQTFYPMTRFEHVDAGDYLAARCTYDSREESMETQIGATSGDEMCNLYLMYYTDEQGDEMRICGDEEVPSLTQLLPTDSDWTLDEISPPRNDLGQVELAEDVAEGESDFVGDKTKKNFKGAQPQSFAHRRSRRTAGSRQLQPRSSQTFDPSYSYGVPNLYPPLPQPIIIHNHHPVPHPVPYVPPSLYNPFQQPPPNNPYQPYSSSNDGGGDVYDDDSGGGGGGYVDIGNGAPGADSVDYEMTRPEEELEEDDQAPPSFYWDRPSIHGLSHEDQGPTRKGKKLKDADLHPVPNWPAKETADQIGQVSGVSLDVYNNPVIFHRGDRVWNARTFRRNNEYAGNRSNPIVANTILTLNSSGHVVNAWGSKKFFMPHMITVDKQNNIWVTDVAMHQVFKFQPYGGISKQPLIVLGTPFEPGSDDTHYCKPTSVAALDSGDTFFVADGYCNSRVLKYSIRILANGSHKVVKVQEWGEADGSGISIKMSPKSFNVPHALALAEDKELVCVADRENSRVVCFNISTGKHVKTLQPDEMGRVYSIAYSQYDGGSIYALNGPEPFGVITGRKTQGLIINVDSGEVTSVFNGGGDGFQNPHDLAVTRNGSVLYEGELQPFRVFKLANAEAASSASSSSSSSSSSASTTRPDLSVPANFNPASVSLVNESKTSKGFFGMMGSLLPSSALGVSIAMASVLFTCLFSACLACRRCRKRGKGIMTNGVNLKQRKSKKSAEASSTSASSSTLNSRKKRKKLDLGDILGRSKEGFQRVRTEDDDDDDDEQLGSLSSDEDDLEEFSIPALRA